MVKGKGLKKLSKKLDLEKKLRQAKLGGAAVVTEKATDIIDNRYVNAGEAAALGFAVGGVPGAIVGGGIGYLIGDQYITFPMPMIAIPAHETYLLNGTPSMKIYIRAGETLVPTGGDVDDYEEGLEESAAMQAKALSPSSKTKKKLTSYQRKYKKEFAKIAPKHKLKNGKWKKGGFKAAVKAAHRMCK